MEYSKIYPFWDKLSEEEKENISRECYTVTYDKGTVINSGKDSCIGIMTVLKGRLRVYIISEEGREVTLFWVYENEVCVLSASCLLDNIDFDVFIEATENTEVLILPSCCLNYTISNNVHVELYLNQIANDNFSDVMWTMQQILFKKIDQRVAALLLDESNEKKTLSLNITHDEIAKYIGSAREVVSKVLKYLSELDVIELKRGVIEIKDKDKLKKLI